MTNQDNDYITFSMEKLNERNSFVKYKSF